MMEFIIGGVVVGLIAGVVGDEKKKKHDKEMKRLENKHNCEMFSKSIELTQANVQLAIEQCNELKASKQHDIELCNEAIAKIEAMERKMLIKQMSDKLDEVIKLDQYAVKIGIGEFPKGE